MDIESSARLERMFTDKFLVLLIAFQIRPLNFSAWQRDLYVSHSETVIVLSLVKMRFSIQTISK